MRCFFERCLMSQNHTSQCPCAGFRALNSTFGKAEQCVCEAETIHFCELTDFHTSDAFGFAIARKMLYLCIVKLLNTHTL